MTEAHAQRAGRAARAFAHLPDVDPGLATLAIWCDTRDADRIDTVTSGDVILVGTGFEKLALQEQIGVLGHHILHIALRHEMQMHQMQARFGSYFQTETYNLSADAVINEILVRAGHGLPRPAVLLRDLMAKMAPDETSASGDLLSIWDADRLYTCLDALDNKSPLADYKHACRFEPDVFPSDPDPSAEQKAAQWRAHLIRAQNAGGSMGRGIGPLLRHLTKLVVSKTPWERKLRRLLNTAMNPSPRENYRRPRSAWIARDADAIRTGRPRPVFEPAILRHAFRPRIVVGFDTSGSIRPGTLSRFAGEVIGIANKSAAELHVLYFDEEVYAHQKIEPHTTSQAFLSKAIRRDGGTSFVEVLTQADALSPSVIVMLSDGLGAFSAPPAAPVIWARPAPVSTVPAFGEVLDLAL